MSRRKSRLYPEEFKQSSIKLAIESDQSISKTSRDLGVNENTLRTWIRFYYKSNEVVDMSANNEIKRLKKQLALVTEERDLLKKAAAYFAVHSQ